MPYIDIASVDVVAGSITNPQELTGEEAPSRARKVVHAYDIIISTCRPTRGAIAVVPENLHGEVCSTGFSIIRCKKGINPYFIHFALRLPSTLEQFRKWCTGSSYPAILDEDVEKTLIPVPTPEMQDAIAKVIRTEAERREQTINQANREWNSGISSVVAVLAGKLRDLAPVTVEMARPIYKSSDIEARLGLMPTVQEEQNGDEYEMLLFGDDDRLPE